MVPHAGQPADYLAEISCKFGLLTLTAEEHFTYFANPDGSIGAESSPVPLVDWLSSLNR